jgi:hypothetical protein
MRANEKSHGDKTREACVLKSNRRPSGRSDSGIASGQGAQLAKTLARTVDVRLELAVHGAESLEGRGRIAEIAARLDQLLRRRPDGIPRSLLELNDRLAVVGQRAKPDLVECAALADYPSREGLGGVTGVHEGMDPATELVELAAEDPGPQGTIEPQADGAAEDYRRQRQLQDRIGRSDLNDEQIAERQEGGNPDVDQGSFDPDHLDLRMIALALGEVLVDLAGDLGQVQTLDVLVSFEQFSGAIAKLAELLDVERDGGFAFVLGFGNSRSGSSHDGILVFQMPRELYR